MDKDNKYLWLGLGLVLGFGLVCILLGKNIIGSFFWSYSLLFSALLLVISSLSSLSSPGPVNSPRCIFFLLLLFLYVVQ